MFRTLKLDSKGIDYLQRRYESLGLHFTPHADAEWEGRVCEGEVGLGVGVKVEGPLLRGETYSFSLGILENKKRSGHALFITPSNMLSSIGSIRHPSWVQPGEAISLEVTLRVDADMEPEGALHLLNIHVVDILP